MYRLLPKITIYLWTLVCVCIIIIIIDIFTTLLGQQALMNESTANRAKIIQPKNISHREYSIDGQYFDPVKFPE